MRSATSMRVVITVAVALGACLRPAQELTPASDAGPSPSDAGRPPDDAGCPAGRHACLDACVEDTSWLHCGSACTPCPAPLSAEPSCDGARCGFICAPGTHACGSVCADDTSAWQCGAVCQVCPAPTGAQAECHDGGCGWACGSGTHACGGACASDGDVHACGAACTDCAPLVVAPLVAACLGQQCRARCPRGLVWAGLECGAARAVALGDGHACALRVDGAVVCWGRNETGQLGSGFASPVEAPAAVRGLDAGVLQVVAGARHTCALLSTGAVSCWGWNAYGQLGSGPSTSTSTAAVPTLVPGLGPAVELASSAAHVCALLASGELWCWGHNSQGQLGRPAASSLPPASVPGLAPGLAHVAAGDEATCALTTDGGAWCWGANGNGQLGTGTTTPSITPVRVQGPDAGFQALSLGAFSACALSQGEPWCWGYESPQVTSRSVPAPVPGLPPLASVDAKGSHRCAVAMDGGAWCWGSNLNGELGDGTTVSRAAAGLVAVFEPVEGLANGRTSTCVVSRGGRVWCFGDNRDGQLGRDAGQSAPWPDLVEDGP